MSHGIRCATARTDKKFCQCSCGGSKHGIQAGLDEFIDTDFKISVTEEAGGEVGKLIKTMKGEEFPCMCGEMIVVDEVFAYHNESGLKDDEGNLWWLYVSCPKCEYDIAFWKIEQRVKTHKREQRRIKKLEKENKK